MSQNFFLIRIHGNCRRDLTHAPMPMQCFIRVKVNPVLPMEKFLFLLLAREVKNKGKFQTFSSKSGRGAYDRWSLTRGSKYSDLT